MEQAHPWRPLIALLANPETRRIAAQVMLGDTIESATSSLSPSKRQRITDALVRSGLVDADSQQFAPGVFRSILDAAAVPKREGIDRFVVDGRITRYPANLEERGRLLAWVASSVFQGGEVLSERDLNGRLLPHSEDVAVLRRYLVDYGLVERRSDGSEYALAAPTG